MQQKHLKNSRFLIKGGLIFSIYIFTFFSTHAQFSKDSIVRKNVVKLDLTGMALFNNAFQLTYERVLRPNRTLGITAGYQELPKLSSVIGLENIAIDRKTASGFKFAVDYRFYLAKENKFKAPRGVFIGPYLAYHNFKNSWDLTIQGNAGPQTGSIDGKFSVFNVGFQTGYQFLINNRWSVDLSFIGASYSRYRAIMNVNGEFDLENSELNQSVINALTDKFPLFDDLINDGKVDQNGKLDSWGFGLRYIVNVGYAFGGGTVKKNPKAAL